MKKEVEMMKHIVSVVQNKHALLVSFFIFIFILLKQIIDSNVLISTV
jgi:hypothetical protein